jgi:hypothetical protein
MKHLPFLLAVLLAGCLDTSRDMPGMINPVDNHGVHFDTNTSEDRLVIEPDLHEPDTAPDLHEPDTYAALDKGPGPDLGPLNGTPCDDGNACTEDDFFADGVCVGGDPVDCTDQNPCTDEQCLPDKGCVYSPTSCNDDDPCTTDSCTLTHGCRNQPMVCPDDGDPCTLDFCSEGACVAEAQSNCAVWLDDSTESCSNDLGAYGEVGALIPTGSLTITITAHQIYAGGSWQATFPDTDCVRTWLMAIGFGDAWADGHAGSWEDPFCMATDDQGVTHVFVAFDPTGAYPDDIQIAIKPWSDPFNAQPPDVYIMNRDSPACDMISAGAMDFGTYNGGHDHGTEGDYLSFVWE